MLGGLAGTARFSAAFRGDAAGTAGAAGQRRRAFVTKGGQESSARSKQQLRLGVEAVEVGQDRAPETVRQQMNRVKCASQTRAAAAASVACVRQGAVSAAPGSRA